MNESITSSETQLSNYLSFGFREKPLSFSAGYYFSRVKGTTDTIKSVDLRSEIELSKNVSLNLGLSNYPEANNYKSNTLTFGINTDFLVITNYPHTEFGVNYSITTHSQKFPTKRYEWRNLKQKSYTLFIAQDLPLNFYVSIDYTAYQYDRDIGKLEEITSYYRMTSLYGLLTSFPDKTYSFNIAKSITSFFDLSFSGARLYYVIDGDYTNSLAVNLDLYLGKLTLGCGVNLQYLSSDTSSTSKYINFSAGYKF